jgi:GNAT superfamily N-acetyltransferase
MNERGLPSSIRIRPIRRRDFVALELFYAGLSLDSLDARFHGATRGIGDQSARSFCGPDHRHREGLVAVERMHTGREVIVGHLCLEPIDGTSDLEMAVAVADTWQHRGIGRALLAAAIEWASAHGVARLRAAIRWSNPAIIGLLRSVERPMTFANDGEGDLEAVIEVGGEIPVAA